MSSGPPLPHEMSSAPKYNRIDDPMDIDSELESLRSEQFSSSSDQSGSFYEVPETPTSSRPLPTSPAATLAESTPPYIVQRENGFPSSRSEREHSLAVYSSHSRPSNTQREVGFQSSSPGFEYAAVAHPPYSGPSNTLRENGYPPSSSDFEHPLATVHQPYSGPGTDAPPSYSKIVMEKPMCMICEKRPAYTNGVRAYPTCGNTCRRKLEVLQSEDKIGNPHWIPQQVGKGYSRASDQARMGSSVSEEHGYGQSQWSSSSKYGPNIKMCEVCKTRPRYFKGGKTYPTCGLTCAAKLNPPTRNVEKCDLCKTKPKQVVDNKLTPYCGQVCRNKADVAASNSSVCATCLICWRANTDRTFVYFCSEECNRTSMTKTSLLEIPRGHVEFKKINEFLTSRWKETRTPCPQIKRAYKVNVTEPSLAAYTAYKTRTEQQLRGRFSFKSDKNAVNEKTRFLGIRRNCGFGDTGSLEPCASHRCLLCAIVRMNVRQNEFPNGVISTGLMERAVETGTSKKLPVSKFVLVASIIHGQEAELLYNEEHILPNGSHSIKLMRYRPGFVSRATSYLEETVVFDDNAILPLYLISLV